MLGRLEIPLYRNEVVNVDLQYKMNTHLCLFVVFFFTKLWT